MKKMLVTLLLLLFSVFICFGCNDDEFNKYKYNSNPSLSDELLNTFKIAYANSISEYVETVDLNEIKLIKYYGSIGDAHIVSMKSSYLGKYPNGVYRENVENMEFGYDIGNKVYIIYQNTLYTAKEAYDKKIINFDNLCMVFGIHTSKLDTFNENAYRKLEKCIKNKFKEESALYMLSRYYGEYNGYYAVSYNYLGEQSGVTYEDRIYNITFGYGYKSSQIRLMNDTNMYTIENALNENIISKNDVYDLFELHTKSDEINEELITKLLTPAYELCLKYEDDFDKKLDLNSFYLTNYYGKYGDVYIYSLETYDWINFSNSAATSEEIDIMKYGFSHMAYVLNDSKLYTLDQAIKASIVNENIKDEIIAKYYGYYLE